MDFKDYQSKLSDELVQLLKTVEKGTLQGVKVRFNRYKKSNDIHDDEENEVYRYVLLVTALRRQHKSMIRFLVKECPLDAQRKTGYHYSPFYYAVQMGDLDIFKLLWKRRGKACIFDKDYNSDTALELAMIKRADTIINFILDDVAASKNSEEVEEDLDPYCKDDISLFHAACWTGHSEAIKVFLSLGFSLKSRSNFHKHSWKGFTSLHFALRRSIDSEAITNLLKKDDADIFVSDREGRTPLHLDFRNDSSFFSNSEIGMDLLISLLSKKHFFNPKDESGLTHFHILCSMKVRDRSATKHLNLIRSFIDNQVNVDFAVSLEDEKYPGFSALHFAAKGSSWNVLKLLLENGADPTKRGKKNRVTPLHLICGGIKSKDEQQRLEITKLLLQYGADPTAKDDQNRTPLHTSFHAHPEGRSLAQTEKFLLAKNRSGIDHTDKYGVSYLHIACIGDDLDIIENSVVDKVLVNSCIHKHSLRYAGYSALHIAVRFNKVEFVEYLLNHGADANQRVKGAKITPLRLACDHTLDQLYETKTKNHKDVESSRRARIRIIELLIQKGARVDDKSSSGKTALLVNCRFPVALLSRKCNKNQAFTEEMLNEVITRQKMIMDILLLHGADINIRCKDDRSILHILSKSYGRYAASKELAEIALRRGADVNASGGNSKHTALHEAVIQTIENKRDTSMIDLLLKHGANINAKTKDTADTPLYVALLNFDKKLKKLEKNVFTKLLDHPYIDVNAQNSIGRTLLHLATDRRMFFCIRELLKSGADINLEDSNGSPPTYDFLYYMKLTYDDPSVEDEDHRILLAVVLHVKKLLSLNCHVSGKVMRHHTSLSGYLTDHELAIMDSGIDAEVRCLKSQKLDTYTSFYDLLFKDSNSMSKHVLNSELQEAISAIHSRSKYPIFGDIIERQYEKGFKRSEILEPAKKALNFVTDVRWPHSCAEEILRYLSDENLNNLIESVSDDKIHTKPSKDLLPSGESPMKIFRHQ